MQCSEYQNDLEILQKGRNRHVLRRHVRNDLEELKDICFKDMSEKLTVSVRE